MNNFLWVMQVLLALHTLLGAVWKFSNSEQAVSSLSAIPSGVWSALSVFEILCAIALVIPLYKRRFAGLVPIGAIGIALEMIVFSLIHIKSSEPNPNPMIYWLVVATLCAFIAFGRLVLKPLHKL